VSLWPTVHGRGNTTGLVGLACMEMSFRMPELWEWWWMRPLNWRLVGTGRGVSRSASRCR
jgi:hypothetical protein